MLPSEDTADTRAYYKNLWAHGFRYPGVHSFRAGRMASKQAYQNAGISNPLGEISFVELHDAYTSSEIQTYEDMGLCRYGEGVPLPPAQGVHAHCELWNESPGQVGMSGQPQRRPDRLRPSGGRHRPDAGRVRHLAATGTIGKHFGDATLQVPNARRGAIHSHAGTGTYVTVSILEKEN